VSVRQTKPRDADEIVDKLGLRGGYTTYFEDNPTRGHNIALALSSFNGLVVQKGETVSFNKTVGPRSSARGFQEAKIIIDGEFVPGVGGGVCQASTTLFNALLMAGLRIDKSHNHSIAISYVPIGRDAMVSSAADLRFTNNTGGVIYIEAGVADGDPNAAWVRIYGNKTAVEYKPRTEVIEHEIGEDEIDPARESLTYIEAWSGEKLVHSKLVRKSKYKARKLISLH
jgi:vancomycin resistance protein YoaR